MLVVNFRIGDLHPVIEIPITARNEMENWMRKMPDGFGFLGDRHFTEFILYDRKLDESAIVAYIVWYRRIKKKDM